MKNKENNGTKRNITFGMGMLIYVMIMILVGYMLILLLWKYAEQYERTLPTEFMDEYVSGLDMDFIRDRAAEALNSLEHEFQTDQECAEYILSSAEDSITYSRSVSSGIEDSVSYTISCGALNVGTVTLAPDYSGKIRFSMVPWKLVSENYSFSVGYTPLKVLVPAGGRLEINSHMVDDSYITGRDIRNEYFESYYDQYPTIPLWTEYTVEHLIGDVPFCIYDSNGYPCTKGADTDYARLLAPGDADGMYERISGFIDNFEYRYIYFTSAVNKDYWGGYNSLQGYLLQGSDLQIRMRNAIDGLTWANTSGFTIDSTELHSIYSIGNGWYLCDYTSTFSVTGKGTTTNNYKLLIVDNNNDIRAADLNMY